VSGTEPSPNGEGLRRRLRAARIIAGYDRMEDLAATLNVAGLGTDTLYEIERGKRGIQRHELKLIAEACELPYEFFTADLRLLADNARERRASDIRMQRIDENVRELVERWREEAMPAFTAYLDRLAAGPPDEADPPNDEASAPTQGRR
jgi:transcriptional regulator with XRE-family HTH domain